MPLFIIVPLLGFAYVVWHVWYVLPWAAPWRWTAVGLCAACMALAVMNMTRAMDRLPMWAATLAYEIGTSTLFVALYLFMAFAVLDLLRLTTLVSVGVLRHNGITALVLAVACAGIFIAGNIHYNNKVRREITLPIARTDTVADRSLPVRMVLVSDLHIGYNNRRKELARWVDMINAEHADLILVAGDIIDMSLRPLNEEDMAAELRRLNAPVYACLGNHEYYAVRGTRRGGEHDDMSSVEAFYDKAGIHLLRDEAVTVGQLCIIGRDDRSAHRRKTLAELTKAARQTDNGYTIVLDHQPFNLEAAERAGIDFQFSGHTHHGQVWPISWITDRVYECAYGLHRRGNTLYYVSSGLGIWGGKYRIGTCSEYVVATLAAER